MASITYWCNSEWLAPWYRLQFSIYEKNLHGSALTPFLANIIITQYKKGLDLTKWDKWTAIIKRHNHNIWCTSDINKSVPEGLLFPSTPADFFGGAQDFCLLSLFSFLKWCRHINSCNAVAKSATRSKIPARVVHCTGNLSVVYS